MTNSNVLRETAKRWEGTNDFMPCLIEEKIMFKPKRSRIKFPESKVNTTKSVLFEVLNLNLTLALHGNSLQRQQKFSSGNFGVFPQSNKQSVCLRENRLE